MGYPTSGTADDKIRDLSNQTLAQIKESIQVKYDALNAYGIGTDINTIKDGYKKFTRTAGVVKPQELEPTITRVNSKIAEIAEFNKVVSGLIPVVSNHSSISNKVSEMGTLKSQVYAARAAKKVAAEDAEISKTRKNALVNHDKEVSYNQLFGGFTRPLKIMSLPILIALTLFFVSVAIFFIYYLFMGGSQTNSIAQNGITKSSQNIMKNLGLKQL